MEDLAESYTGNNNTGHPAAILSMFSFGTLKRYTAFAGSLSFVRDPDLYSRMVAVHNTFRIQTKAELEREK